MSNVEDELHRIFTDGRLDIRARSDASASIVAGAQRLRRKRIALITGAGMAGVAVLAAAAFTLTGSVAPSPTQPTVGVAGTVNRPGDSTVRLDADAAAHPLHEDVRQLLQAYFDAINAKDHAKFLTVVTAKRAEGQSVEDWLRAYRSTQDGNIVVRWIQSGQADNATAQVTFTSVQDPEDAPPRLVEPCINWTVVFPLKIEGGAWNVDWAPPSSAPVKC